MTSASTYTYEIGYNPVMGVVTRADARKKGVQGFLSVDPLTSSYPMLTPYQFASNTPIWAIDVDGLEMVVPDDFEMNYNLNPADWDVEDTWIGAGIGAVQGLFDAEKSLAPISIPDQQFQNLKEDEQSEANNKELSAWEYIKAVGQILVDLPETASDVYRNGTMQEKARFTAGFASLGKGKTPGGAVTQLVFAGFNKSLRILTVTQNVKIGVVGEARQVKVAVPKGCEPITVTGSKATVFKKKGSREFISPDIDGHNVELGAVWKKASGKATNLFKKETRDGTFNADLSKKVAD